MNRIVLAILVLASALIMAPMAFADDTTAPAAITNLTIEATGPHTAWVSWTSTGDDGTTGTATSYLLVYSTTPIYDIHQSGLTVIPTGSPVSSGNFQCASVEDLLPSHPYYFAIIAIDEANNESSLSNTPSGGTPYSGNEVAC
jgi:hypothetical protein